MLPPRAAAGRGKVHASNGPWAAVAWRVPPDSANPSDAAPRWSADDAAPFRERVFAWVAAIPEGRVATYGQIAALAGSPNAARQVGAALRGALSGGALEAVPGGVPERAALPWHRVVNAAGGISTDKLGFGARQRERLRREGVAFDAAGRLDLERYRWDPGRPTAEPR